MTVLEGSDIIGALLLADEALLQLVPEERIKAGLLPEGSALPALLVNGTSSTDRQPLTREAQVRRTDRVSVTVRAAPPRSPPCDCGGWRRACAGKTGQLGGGRNVSILTAGMGPDVNGPGGSFEKTQDFRVSWDAED